MHPPIPYTGEARPDTGLYNAKLGVWLFLAAEAMFFGALISSFVFLRVAAENWPVAAEVLPMGLSALNTVVMLGVASSSAHAWAVLRVNRGGLPRRWLWLAAGGGLASVLLLTWEQFLLRAGGINAATHNFYALYFLFAGLQWFHLLGGVAVTAYLALFGRRLREREPLRFTNHVECIGLYWQFLTGLWLVMMSLFYML